jgi:DNA ligase-1
VRPLLWKPLLAVSFPFDPVTGDFRWDFVRFPVWASPKLDGYRAMVQRGALVSRNGVLVANRELQRRYGRKGLEGLDAELCAGCPATPGVFNLTSRVVRRADADASTTTLYMIDRHGMPGGDFGSRHTALKTALRDEPYIMVIKQVLVKTLAALQAFERECLRQGYEGVMLRRGDQGPYPQKPGKENRSTLREFDLVRLKRFEYAEAVILAVHSLRHNLNDARTRTGKRVTDKDGIVVDKSRIGSATLRDVETGVEFDTTVASEALRSWAGWRDPARWRGMTVRYKYQAVGTLDKPRINTCAFEELL